MGKYTKLNEKTRLNTPRDFPVPPRAGFVYSVRCDFCGEQFYAPTMHFKVCAICPPTTTVKQGMLMSRQPGFKVAELIP